jgi:uncharacterized membrane protein
VRAIVLASAPAVALLNLSALGKEALRVLLYTGNWRVASVGAAQICICLGVPIAAFIYFRQARISNFLIFRDPRPSWTDSVEVPLFAWAAACILFGTQRLLATSESILSFRESNLPALAWLIWIAGIVLDLLLVGAAAATFRRSRVAWIVSVAIAMTLAIFSSVSPGIYFDWPSLRLSNNLAYRTEIAFIALHCLVYLTACSYGIYTGRYLRKVPALACDRGEAQSGPAMTV